MEEFKAKESSNQPLVDRLLRLAEEYFECNPNDPRLDALDAALTNVSNSEHVIHTQDQATAIGSVGPFFAAVMFDAVVQVEGEQWDDGVARRPGHHRHQEAKSRRRAHNHAKIQRPKPPRRRRHYTPDEIAAIQQGLDLFGYSWNSMELIRQKFPVLRGRTVENLYDTIRQTSRYSY